MRKRLSIAALAILLLAALTYGSFSAPMRRPVDWIALGLSAERRHDDSLAETDLLKAAASDHQYGPRWTLAGFYFRHDRPDEFWKWSREALTVGTRDLGALFDLCWLVSDSPDFIWSQIIPDRRETWNEYLAYLLAAGHWEAGVDTARRLTARATSSDLPVLTAFCENALARKEPAAALPVWNGLCQRGLIHSDPIENGHYLVNRAWQHSPSAGGFDWRMASLRDVREYWSPGELHISFSGLQADRVELLSQQLAVAPGAAYVLNYQYTARNMPGDSGVRWHAGAEQSRALAGDGRQNGTFRLEVPASSPAVTLTLVYERQTGSARTSGTLQLGAMDLTSAP